MSNPRQVKQVIPAILEDGTQALLHHFVRGGVIVTVHGQKAMVSGKAVPAEYRRKLRERDKEKQ